ncbi:glutamate receptor 2.2 [Phtheirospermum japonicum]|uniref:Glutamate receptor n=1 Tax=Phtheirospermum japonicum TaxID=374723 RepID=A0A830B1X8_9LAMI|nr:glutamate receptor 2.2 [Phtheirospermum japonicum]
MAAAQIIPVKVGVVIDMNDYGEMILTCISMALSEFYATHDHYRTRLVLTNRDSKGDVVGASAAGLDLLKNVQVQAIIGPEYSTQANFLISLGHKAQVPIITFSATSPSLSSLRSPYFVRATLKDSSQVKTIGAIVKTFGWQEVVLIYEDNDFGEGVVPFLTDAFENVSARVTHRSVISPQATDDQIRAELYNLMTMQTRVFVVHMVSRLASRLFTLAKGRGMMSREYAWIVTDGITNELSLMDRSVVESMLGVIGVKPHVPKTEELDDFAARYKQRFSTRSFGPGPDIFVLWAYDATIALAMAAESAILASPTYRTANISGNSTDLEAFGVSESGPGLIRALSTTTFKGLAGDFRLIDGELQAPPFEIINMVGPGYRVIGYWTEKSGLIKDLNVTGGKPVSGSKLGSIIWPGDGSSAPKGWVIPTYGKKLRVGVPVKDGFTEFMRVTWNSDNSTRVEGYCIDVFEAVMGALPFGVQYEYIPFATTDRHMAGNYNDLTNQVFLGNFDAVAGDVTIVANRSEYVDFTLPYTASAVAMVVPYEDDKSKNAMVFTKPLTWQLWVTTLFSFIFIGSLVWIIEHERNTDFQGTSWYQVGTMFLFAFSTVVFAHKEKVRSNLSKTVLVVWFMVVLVITQSYTANLASMLTVQKLQPKVTDVNVLVKSKDYVGYTEGSFVFGVLKDWGFDESRLIKFNSMGQLDELLSKGSGNGGISAGFHETPYLKLFLSKYCLNYTMIDSLHKADGFGFVFPKGSPLAPHVSRAILKVTESPKMSEIEKKWLSHDKSCPDPDALRLPKSLGIESFWVLFAVIGGVGLLMLLFYVGRFLYRNWNNEVNNPEIELNNQAINRENEVDNQVIELNDLAINRENEVDNREIELVDQAIDWDNELANMMRIVDLVRTRLLQNNNQAIIPDPNINQAIIPNPNINQAIIPDPNINANGQ